jgi:N-methylhydantoinase A
MVADGAAQLAVEGATRVEHQAALDLRYLKQYHEVTVPVAIDALERGDLSGAAAAFHREHDRLFGYSLEEEGTGLELISVRVRSLGRTARLALPRVERAPDPDASAALKGERRAFVPETGSFATLPVLDGARLLAGHAIRGPALVDRADTSIVVSAAYDAEVDDRGTVVLRRRTEEAANA